MPSPVSFALMASMRAVTSVSHSRKQTLGLGCARAGGGEEFGLKTLAVASGVFLPHVVGEPLASGEVSLCVLTYRDHPQHTLVYELVYELVYAARFQMVNVCRKIRLISTFRVVLVGVAGFEPATPSSRTPCTAGPKESISQFRLV